MTFVQVRSCLERGFTKVSSEQTTLPGYALERGHKSAIVAAWQRNNISGDLVDSYGQTQLLCVQVLFV